MNSPLRLAFVLSFAAAGLACSSSSNLTPTPVAASTITGKVALTGASDSSGVALTAVGPMIGSASTAADGTYSFTKLQAGTYTVTAAVGDSREHVQATTVTVAATQSAAAADLTFTLLGAITGKAQKAGATDHSGIEVGVLGQDATALTDAAGNFRLDGVLLGAQTLSASAAGFTTATKVVTAARGVTPAGTLPLAAVAGPGTTSISGKVLLGVDDQSGVFVTATGPTMASTLTAHDGTYSFPNLAQGTWFVTARVGDSVEGQQTVLVAAGATAAHAADLSFTLVGSVTGTAKRTGSASADQSGILVGMLGTAQTAITDAAGAYRFDGVLLGAHAISASAAGYTAAGLTVTAARGTTTAAALNLAPIASTTNSLAVSVVGSGQVLSAPAGVSCANSCTASFPTGSAVVLYAEPSPGYVFGSWSVAACTQPFCPVTVSADTQVTATFLLEPISVSIIGPGRGTVQFLGASGGQTKLLPLPEPGYTFVGWRGACTGRGECVLSGGRVQAAFTELMYWSFNPQWAVYGISLTGANKHVLSSAAALGGDSYGFDADGLNLAYVSNLKDDFSGNGPGNLWAIDLVTNQARSLTHYQSGSSVAQGMPPAYSPDGKTLAFLSNQSPTSTDEMPLPDANSWFGANLFTVKRDGTGLKPLTQFVAGELLVQDYPFNTANLRAFAWSPDGKQLAFVARDATLGYANLFTIGADGSSLTEITHFSSSTLEGDPRPYGVSWSPDGKKLAFVSPLQPNEGSAPPNTVSSFPNLWTVTVADGTLFCVSYQSGNAMASDAVYSRSGNSIVYVTAPIEGGYYSLHSINDDGSGQVQLDSNTSYLSSPIWHSDNTTLVYERYDTGETPNGLHLWRTQQPDADGGTPGPQQITTGSNSSDYTWDDNDD
jgi:Tol biopolymer transport system component